jgi:rhamnosyltransferase
MNKSLASCLKCSMSVAKQTAIFVAVEIDRELRSGVEIYLHALRKLEVKVVLVIQSEHYSEVDRIKGQFGSLADELWVRPNVGFDFGAWADVLVNLRDRETLPADRLFFLNDSLLGPFRFSLLQNIFRKILASDFDFVGLTENKAPQPHVQSYFLSFSPKLYRSVAFWSFVEHIENKTKIEEVIADYEIGMTRAMLQSGYKVAVVFPSRILNDPTVYDAAYLIKQGFPFVKRKLFVGGGHYGVVNEIASISYFEGDS